MSMTHAPAAAQTDLLAGAFASVDNPLGGPAIAPFVAPIQAPRASYVGDAATMTVRETSAEIHPHLPPVPVWGYGRGTRPAQSPGALLEVSAGRPCSIQWRNELATQALPFLTSVVTGDDPDDSVQNHVGSGTGSPADLAAAPVGWLVTHVHGGHVGPESDGWPDHMVAPGGVQRCHYTNDDDNAELGLAKVGASLWYHDHAMDATRLHVMAGLFGGYLVRHPREAALGLPTTAESGEVVLLVQDRNLGVDDCGTLRLLHKTTDETAEFFGPLTMVNGALWPRLPVSAGVVRLRLYNGSNARHFRLHLLDQQGMPVHSRVLVIGTDAGLLWRAARLADDAGITLAPAERVDLLVDLRGLAGHHVYVVNSAAAPFSGDPAPDDLVTPRPGERIPFPQVMRLDVQTGQQHVKGRVWDDLAAGVVLNPAYRRVVHHASGPDPARPAELVLPGDHEHRLVVLSESDPPGHLQLTELTPDPSGTVEIQLPNDAAPQRYSPKGSSFYDAVGIMPALGKWEVWRFLNTTGDTHPMHIHQSTFQPLGAAGTAYVLDDAHGLPLYDQATHSTSGPMVPDPTGTARAFEPAEITGWKDTLRVDPGQLVSVAIRFDRVGRYVYHCHIIEHEDHEMMRPFVVTQLPMGMGAHHQH